MKTQRVMVTLPQDMYKAVKQLADRERRPMAEIIRVALEEHLDRKGISVTGSVTWGGNKSVDDESPEVVAVAAM